MMVLAGSCVNRLGSVRTRGLPHLFYLVDSAGFRPCGSLT
jgi:hypothetical protein